jgi:hypothetical protein
VYITNTTPVLLFIGIWVSATDVGPHVPPMLINGGIVPLKVMRHVNDMPHNL